MRQGYPLSPLFLSKSVEVLANAKRQEKKVKGIRTDWEGRNKILFIDDMIIHLGNLNESTKKIS